MSSFKDIIHGFVPEACADDDALRRDVESLLAQSISADGFLDSPAMAAAAQMISDSGSGSTFAGFAGWRLGVYDARRCWAPAAWARLRMRL